MAETKDPFVKRLDWPSPTLVMALRLARPEQAVHPFLHTPDRISAYLTARHWTCEPGEGFSLWSHPILSSRFPLPGLEQIRIPDVHPYDVLLEGRMTVDEYRAEVGRAVSRIADAYSTGELSILAEIANTKVHRG